MSYNKNKTCWKNSAGQAAPEKRETVNGTGPRLSEKQIS